MKKLLFIIIIVFSVLSCDKINTAETHTLNIKTYNGTFTKTPDQEKYDIGTKVQLTATSNMGYTFASWTEGTTILSKISKFEVIMTEDKNLVANVYSLEIYGNDDCVYTTSLRNECSKLNIYFQYFSVANTLNYKKVNDLVIKYSLGQIITATVNGVISKGILYNYPIVKVQYNNDISGLERPAMSSIKKIIGE